MSKRDGVTFEFDPTNPPPLSDEKRAQIDALAAMSDDAIDTSDIPPLTDAFFARAVRNPFYRPVKQQLTVRLDADVLAWLKAEGRGYQTRINAILREAMLRKTAPSPK
jgi:uncharacterized protein (DUF4415 family)